MFLKWNIGADPSVKEDVKHREALKHEKITEMMTPNNETVLAVEQWYLIYQGIKVPVKSKYCNNFLFENVSSHCFV